MPSLGDLVQFVRARGARSLVGALVRGFIFRDQRRLITVRPLDEPIPMIEPPAGVEVRPARAEDLDRLHELVVASGWWRRRGEFHEWLCEGCLFFVAAAGGRPVGYRCVAPVVTTWDAMLRRAVPLGEFDAWGADAFVAPKWRGRGIFPAVEVVILRGAREKGWRRVLASVDPQNPSARRAHAKTGYRELAEVRLRRLLFCTRASVTLLGERRYGEGPSGDREAAGRRGAD